MRGAAHDFTLNGIMRLAPNRIGLTVTSLIFVARVLGGLPRHCRFCRSGYPGWVYLILCEL